MELVSDPSPLTFGYENADLGECSVYCARVGYNRARITAPKIGITDEIWLTLRSVFPVQAEVKQLQRRLYDPILP